MKAVPGEGNFRSEIVFVGEAPGAKEDETGRPFVGSAGQLLTQLIRTYLKIDRTSVYITNLVKCRPPENRDPKDEEIDACSPYLIRQIEAIKPKIIVTLGRHSTKYFQVLAGRDPIPISRCHGNPFHVYFSFGKVLVFPSYHPAAALYNPPLRKEMEKDFLELSRLLNKGPTGSNSVTIDMFLNGNGPWDKRKEGSGNSIK
nr:uracil-DNA glycosylase [Metallosphaera hakonensis]